MNIQRSARKATVFVAVCGMAACFSLGVPAQTAAPAAGAGAAPGSGTAGNTSAGHVAPGGAVTGAGNMNGGAAGRTAARPATTRTGAGRGRIAWGTFGTVQTASPQGFTMQGRTGTGVVGSMNNQATMGSSMSAPSGNAASTGVAANTGSAGATGNAASTGVTGNSGSLGAPDANGNMISLGTNARFYSLQSAKLSDINQPTYATVRGRLTPGSASLSPQFITFDQQPAAGSASVQYGPDVHAGMLTVKDGKTVLDSNGQQIQILTRENTPVYRSSAATRDQIRNGSNVFFSRSYGDNKYGDYDSAYILPPGPLPEIQMEALREGRAIPQ